MIGNGDRLLRVVGQQRVVRVVQREGVGDLIGAWVAAIGPGRVFVQGGLVGLHIDKGPADDVKNIQAGFVFGGINAYFAALDFNQLKLHALAAAGQVVVNEEVRQADGGLDLALGHFGQDIIMSVIFVIVELVCKPGQIGLAEFAPGTRKGRAEVMPGAQPGQGEVVAISRTGRAFDLNGHPGVFHGRAVEGHIKSHIALVFPVFHLGDGEGGHRPVVVFHNFRNAGGGRVGTSAQGHQAVGDVVHPNFICFVAFPIFVVGQVYGEYGGGLPRGNGYGQHPGHIVGVGRGRVAAVGRKGEVYGYVGFADLVKLHAVGHRAAFRGLALLHNGQLGLGERIHNVFVVGGDPREVNFAAGGA